MRLTFVTGNAGKYQEATLILAGLAELTQDRGGYTEIQADTLAEVARYGLAEVSGRLAPPFFLEDAGLFVDALQGFPGVYSAPLFHATGWDGLLRLLHGVPEARRTAHFEAAVGYRDPHGRDHVFVGRVDGHIAAAGRGTHGFGFDPVFVPQEGDGRTFAELTAAEKSRISHRGRALRALARHLAAAPHEKAS